MRHGIGITCIGSGVGQSVINSCRLSALPLRTIGLGTNPFAYGAYDCDVMDSVPAIYRPEYIPALLAKCREHDIRLVIPGLDDETLILAEAAHRLEQAGVRALVADAQLIRVCRDKERMSHTLNRIADVFVRGYDRLSIQAALTDGSESFPLIAKPRGGFASRGVRILLDRRDLEEVEDSHIIQELAVPHRDDPNREEYLSQIEQRLNPQLAEISIQLVTGRDGRLLGRMASYNKLQNGVPIEVLPFEHEVVWSTIDRLLPAFRGLGLRGPLNIQGRLTEKGLKLFEMNPRFTGITGLRAIMGFNEVEACIRDWLALALPIPPLRMNHGAFGTRQTADKAIPLGRNPIIGRLSVRLNRGAMKRRPVLLVTGSTGHLGRHLARAAHRTHEVWTLDRSKDRARTILAGVPDLRTFDHEDLACGNLPLGLVDVLVHTAFGRPHTGELEVASSLSMTGALFERAVAHQVPAIVNLSSQSVYGTKRPPAWTEALSPAPETPYAASKYSSELMARAGHARQVQCRFTSLRLAALSGGSDGFQPIDLLAKLALQALAGRRITIRGGQQRLPRLDIRDAVDAVLALLRLDPREWEDTYNVGPVDQHSLLEMAEKVIASVAAGSESRPVEITLEHLEGGMNLGMDSSRFTAATGWTPRHTIDDTIRTVVDYLREEALAGEYQGENDWR